VLVKQGANERDVAKKLSAIFDKIEKIEDCFFIIDDIHIITESTQGSSGAVTNLISVKYSFKVSTSFVS